jgi:hypothetical protein
VSRGLGPWVGALALAFASPASAVTPEQAQSLPLPELARLVLGQAGALVVEVDRPKWPTGCQMIACPTFTEEQLKQPPPLSFGLNFYLRPFAASDMSNRWTGLCGVVIIEVSFDNHDEMTGIGTQVRWGVPNGLERVPATGASNDFLARQAAATEKCRSVKDSRAFFVSDADDTSAFRVAIAAQLFGEAARRGASLPFEFKCESYRWECKDGGAEAVAERFRPANIARAMQVDCAPPHLYMTSIGPAGCYEVWFDDPGETLLVEVANGYSDLTIKRVEYTRSTIVY